MTHNIETYKVHLAASCLLMTIAFADELLEKEEIEMISDILQDFFEINKINSQKLIDDAQEDLNTSIDLFSYGQILNQHFSQQDKLDFIGCIFEVAFSDGELHHLESNAIRKIANILNIEHRDLISRKMEIKRFL